MTDTTADRLAVLIDIQREFQSQLGHDFHWMSDQARIEYLKTMILAATDELHEALNEMSWKSWAKNQFIHDQKIGGELIDLLHFVFNMFLCVGMDANSIYDRYLAKHEVNRTRQDTGYDGVSTKCTWCKRALDEPGSSGVLTLIYINGDPCCSENCAAECARP